MRSREVDEVLKALIRKRRYFSKVVVLLVIMLNILFTMKGL